MSDDPYLARIAAKDVRPGMTLQVRELMYRAKDYTHHVQYKVVDAVEKTGRAYYVPVTSWENTGLRIALRVSTYREKADRILLFNRTWAPLPEEDLREVQDHELAGFTGDVSVWCDYLDRWSDTTIQDWFTVEQERIYRPSPPDVLLTDRSGRGLFISPSGSLVRSRRFYVRKDVPPKRSRVVSLLEVES